jgi:capsular exopolysaccharide synthesis family protein
MPEAKQPQLILTSDTLHTHFAEAYRALRANISFSGVDNPLKTVVVTSASSNEGKTTTVINLGIIMAQAGPRVLIVDTDLRRPSIHEVMGLWNSRRGPLLGLSNVMVGAAKMDDVIMETNFDRLGLVPAGAMPPNPSELLGSRRLQVVMNELKERADFVLFDTPPCLAYSDAFLISSLADGVLYVFRAGNQDKAAQRRVQKQMQQAKVRILGAVFNDVDMEESTGTYSYYGNGHVPRK